MTEIVSRQSNPQVMAVLIEVQILLGEVKDRNHGRDRPFDLLQDTTEGERAFIHQYPAKPPRRYPQRPSDALGQNRSSSNPSSAGRHRDRASRCRNFRFCGLLGRTRRTDFVAAMLPPEPAPLSVPSKARPAYWHTQSCRAKNHREHCRGNITA